MPAKSPSSNRWKAATPEQAIEPRGSIEFLRRAVERLGPFSHKLHDEARLTGSRNAMGVALSEELALERVFMLAWTYNQQQHHNAHAPRTKDTIEALTKLETLAGELAHYFNSLDDMTLMYLYTMGTGVGDFPSRGHMDEVDDSGLPAPSSPDEFRECWASILNELSRHTHLCVDMFLKGKGIEDVDHADRGGNTNLFKDMFGSPEWGLVQGGWLAYDLFKPGKATGTEGGPFHCFLMDVFEFATGKDQEEHARLTSWLKKVVTSNRRYKEIIDRQMALESEAGKAARSSDQKRSAEIAAELIKLAREQDELSPSLFPHNHRRQSGSEPRSGA